MVLLAKHLAHIGIARGVGAVGHMGLHHGHGEVRPQHHLAAQGVMGDIGAGADILAVQVQKRLGGLQDVGVHRDGPCGQKGGVKPLRFGTNGGLGRHSVSPAGALPPTPSPSPQRGRGGATPEGQALPSPLAGEG